MPKRTFLIVVSVIVVASAGLAVFLFLNYGAYAGTGGLAAGAIVLLRATQRRSAEDLDPEAGNTLSFPLGAYYSILYDENDYRIAKLLVHERGICHLRVYKQTFASRPAQIDVAQLTLGSMNDADGFGIGHVPLRESSFLAWKPVFVARGRVLPDEREGYDVWKAQANGSAF